jgi:SNF2 family DNA or RNA helicase
MRVEAGRDEHLGSKHALADRNVAAARRALTTGAGERSAKIEGLKEIIAQCRETQEKVLVFTEFLEVLELATAVIGTEAFVLRGTVPVKERPGIVRRFKETEGFAALVAQIRVGREGLNLQAASVVIIMEPQLTPASEQQAIARAQQMGQTRRVVVYRLIAADSLDEHIVQLTNYKAELFTQLARRSALAEAASELPANVHDAAESELLQWGRDRYGLPPDDTPP